MAHFFTVILVCAIDLVDGIADEHLRDILINVVLLFMDFFLRFLCML